jgi:hypothetical protein
MMKVKVQTLDEIKDALRARIKRKVKMSIVKNEVRVSKQNGRYYPIVGDIVDMRGPGYDSVKSVQKTYSDRTGKTCKVKVV